MKSARIASLLALTIAGAAASTASFADSLVKIDGSSTVYPITEAVAEEFQKAKKNAIKVTVGISGTGGGFKKFCRGETDISDASRPILKKEMEDCKAAGIEYIELPVAYDALTVVINPKNDWIKSLTVEQLKTIWEPGAQGKITSWKQVNHAWPDRPLKLFGPGADSGTFDYFTEAVNGKAKSSRGDFTASEDDNVLVQGVARDVGGLGFFGYAYYDENHDKLKAVPIVAAEGKPAVSPSPRTVVDGTYQPFARPIFIYVNAKSAEKPEIKEFVEFYLKNGEALSKDVKYVPLPSKAYAFNLEHFGKRLKGTKFGGENKVGITIEELMKLEAK
ncbi:PstS family phosphate ABC transporter substrate-binding protein [Rhodocyclus tenuis]|uniref:Phosphate-binding protein n=2 Tax=Rhodocyclus TaxID=1064 RepID=A0A6L5JUX0_RHOTE|nr:PstS family phosphate ABC transporter substrate-binding protein [Rhodocyclus gracilis]MQY51165.1 phosphate ABC transporter substrate-binding protein PstS family protein [Rhodocyclus gracilis]MRD71949.1 phosphate ABC transporter substrate-binding protein PstS family protein [Rhodocyclus gracilis]NJA88874.1 PstS family phosphate ABC transporter substrate-binding protein [Rhodocyclus gracilis]